MFVGTRLLEACKKTANEKDCWIKAGKRITLWKIPQVPRISDPRRAAINLITKNFRSRSERYGTYKLTEWSRKNVPFFDIRRSLYQRVLFRFDSSSVSHWVDILEKPPETLLFVWFSSPDCNTMLSLIE
jgi:hypothetical protein